MDIANLSGSAAKLLLVVLAEGQEPLPSLAWQQRSGVSSPAAFYKARAEVKDNGWLDWLQQMKSTSQSEVHKVKLTSESEVPTTHNEVLASQNEVQKVKSTTESEVPASQYEVSTSHSEDMGFFDEPESLRTRTAQVDEMDDSGDTQQRNTPFQVRRRAQLPLIAEALRDVMGYKSAVGEGALKELLVLAGNSAEAVLDAIEVTANRQVEKKQELPLAFVKAVLRRTADKMTVKSAGIGPPASYDESPPPPSAEYLAWQQRAKAGLIKAGKAKPADYVRENLV